LSILTALPFCATLLCLALLPLLAPRLWHVYEKHVLATFGGVGILALAFTMPVSHAAEQIGATLVHDYAPFITLLLALYTLSCGLKIRLHWEPTPWHNTLFLGAGALFASFIGTTGASILFIRPFLHMNENRAHKVHSVIFFIFLVSNIGGCLTPMGDPPLFLGYLKGVDFFWPLMTLWKPFFITMVAVLSLYYGLDLFFFKKESNKTLPSSGGFSIEGKQHGLYISILVLLIILTGKFGHSPLFDLWGHAVTVGYVVLQLGLVVLTYVSYKQNHDLHPLSFGPVKEVAYVFVVIFITMIPVNKMLEAGGQGPFSGLLSLTQTTQNPALLYFWLTGFFSAFLDNAPTYLIFFKLAGGNPETLMTKHAFILAAISLGSVFMGAMTYIGNAPNFMVRTLAKEYGVAMPTFLGYMGWSILILLPVFLGMSFFFFKH
jgi:Na+/H+ antiporter NhaD/arsenite permease-like protein